MEKVELLDQDELEARLASSLADKTLPDHFLYAGDGAACWRGLSGSQEFPVTAGLAELLEGSIPRIVPMLPDSFDLVSIGAGIGEKEKMLIEALPERDGVRYFPIDASPDMLDMCLAAVEGLGVTTLGGVALLEDVPLLQHFWNSPTLYCMLGNSFSNFDPDDLLDLLTSMMEQGDMLLVDIGLMPRDPDLVREVEEAYCSKRNAELNLGPLLRRGARLHDLDFEIELVQVPTTVGLAYRTSKHISVKRDSVIECGDRKVELPACRLSMGFTYRFTRSQAESLLGRHGLMLSKVFEGRDGVEMLALATY